MTYGEINLERLRKVLRQSARSGSARPASGMSRGAYGIWWYFERSNWEPSSGKLVKRTPIWDAEVPGSMLIRRKYGARGGGRRRYCRTRQPSSDRDTDGARGTVGGELTVLAGAGAPSCSSWRCSTVSSGGPGAGPGPAAPVAERATLEFGIDDDGGKMRLAFRSSLVKHGTLEERPAHA